MGSKDDISNSNSIELVIKVVEALLDMDEDLILDAFDFLVEKKIKPKSLFQWMLNSEDSGWTKLRKWFVRKLLPQHQMQISGWEKDEFRCYNDGYNW